MGLGDKIPDPWGTVGGEHRRRGASQTPPRPDAGFPSLSTPPPPSAPGPRPATTPWLAPAPAPQARDDSARWAAGARPASHARSARHTSGPPTPGGRRGRWPSAGGHRAQRARRRMPTHPSTLPFRPLAFPKVPHSQMEKLRLRIWAEVERKVAENGRVHGDHAPGPGPPCIPRGTASPECPLASKYRISFGVLRRLRFGAALDPKSSGSPNQDQDAGLASSCGWWQELGVPGRQCREADRPPPIQPLDTPC